MTIKKRNIGRLLMATVIFASLSLSVNAQSYADKDPEAKYPSTMTPQKWELFSNQIICALRSNHTGLQEGALRMIIQYGDQIDVSRARKDILHIYSTSKNDNLRRMAVVAVSEMHDALALDYLLRNLEDEKCSGVRHTIAAVLLENGLATQIEKSHPQDELANSGMRISN